MVLGLSGVMLLALSARTGVATLSPLAGDIDLDITLDGLYLGLLGMIPPVAYGIAAWLTKPLARRMSLETLAITVATIAAVGHVMRGVGPNYLGLFIATVVLMLAVGVTNVLLPALVKLYAPAHIGQVTSVYSLMMAVSTAAPAILVVWFADEVGWRWSLASWSVVSAMAVIPWLFLLPYAKARDLSERTALLNGETPPPIVSLWLSPTARWLAILFAVSGLTSYSMFAVLPQILMETAFFSREQAAFAVFLWSLMGVPMSIVIPLLAVRPGWPQRLVVFGSVGGMTGFAGLLLVPETLTYVWVLLTALSALGFSLVVTLIGVLTENHRSAAQLSGLVNTVGYAIAGVGPIAAGLLAVWTGRWWPTIVFLGLVTAVTAFAYPVLRRGRTVDEELRAITAHLSK
jgi:CP family cyanate transporter-like MFS transporter